MVYVLTLTTISYPQTLAANPTLAHELSTTLQFKR
ncbi:hypothetical protein PC120_g24905 [Phytophthora cactorum]|nr:hypothetical protein PC120_g24905 [Phytophthora cactorum]